MRTKLKITVISVIVIILAVSCIFDEFMPYVTKGKLLVEFVDVGDADCTFIKNPDGKTALIDGGNPWNLREVHNTLKKYNIKKIDFLINSHPHDDHIGTFYKLFDLYSIGACYMPKTEYACEALDLFSEKAAEKNIKVNYIKRGDTILDGEVKIEVLSPYQEYYMEENDYSSVCLLTYKEKSFLFMGDMGKYHSNTLVVDYGLGECDVLKVSHHGSNDGTSGFFLEEVRPKYAVVPCGNEYDDRPDEKLVSRFERLGINYYVTRDLGNITMITDGIDIEIKTEREKK